MVLLAQERLQHLLVNKQLLPCTIIIENGSLIRPGESEHRLHHIGECVRFHQFPVVFIPFHFGLKISILAVPVSVEHMDYQLGDRAVFLLELSDYLLLKFAQSFVLSGDHILHYTLLLACLLSLLTTYSFLVDDFIVYIFA